MNKVQIDIVNEPFSIVHSHYDPILSPEDNFKISCGGCRVSGCSCTSFVVLNKHNAQFCENCGHARSQHG